MNRVVFISVLMLLSMTAAARHRIPGFVVADTTVKPGPKGQLAEKLETKNTTVKPGAAGSRTTNTSIKASASSRPTNSSAKAAATSNTSASSKTTSTNIKKAATASSKTTSSPTKAAATTKTSAASKTSNAVTKKAASTTSAAPSKNTPSKPAAKYRPRKPKKGIGIELFPPLTFKYAILLDVPVEKVTDEKLLEILEYWYGTRYRYGGETRKGIDCSAFTQAFMASYFDYQLPRTAEEQYAASKRIKKKKLRQGDLVFFKTRGPKGGITHVGVYLMNNRFVHAATSSGVRISDLNEDYYKTKYAGAGRIR
jgi:Cell wall-associated hydrolases (invasion-associated proteins)